MAVVGMRDSDEGGILEEIDPEEQGHSNQDFWTQACVSLARRSLQHSCTPAILLDPTLRILWTNPAFPASFGGRDTVEGQHLSLYFLESFDEQARNTLYSRSLAEALLADSEYPEVNAEFVENIGFLAAMNAGTEAATLTV